LRYRLAAGVALVTARGAPALLSRTPLRLVTVNAALARLLAAGGELRARSAAEARVLEALFEKGLLLRAGEPVLAPGDLPSVTVVIPVKDRAGELARCLASLGRVRYPAEKLEIVVVDDGSADGTPEVARAVGATVVASGGRGRGPAAARNRGAAVARGDVLAFIDSDCVASEGWLAELAPRFADPEVVAVGGRVDGMHSSSSLDRYEAEMSSLCLGRRGRSGQGGHDTFYLPSCNLLVRRAAFAAAGGFREELQVGEDVDLTWRLRDRGGRIVYTPGGRIAHEHRNRLGPFLRRRFQYGTSEGLLQVLHPGRRKRLVLPPALAAVTALAVVAILAGAPWLLAAAAAVLAGDAVRLARRLARLELRLPRGWVLLARARAWASLAYYLSFHLTRYYGPALVALGLAWPRLGALAAGMAVLAGAVDYGVRRPALPFPTFLGLYLAEHLAYGAGVFVGCARVGTFASYRPSLARDGAGDA
jgi:mycofactocin system glycosyltransferase